MLNAPPPKGVTPVPPVRTSVVPSPQLMMIGV